MKQAHKTLAFWLFLAVCFIVIFNFWENRTGSQVVELTFPELVQKIQEGEVDAITAQGELISGELTDGQRFSSFGPIQEEHYLALLADNQLTPDFRPEPERKLFWNFIGNLVPVLLLVALMVMFMRQMQAGSGRAMSFGKSRARLMSDDNVKVTFDDVAGVDEAKGELQEIVAFLKDPKRFTRLGGRIPKGVLLMGAPGTGKTLLAKAIAGEAGVPFYSISGSDFVEMFVGVGASRVRDLFEQGKKNAPCIIFVDEIDAVGRHRGTGLGGGHDEREQTLNQMLVEMDGFEANDGLIVVAATNRADVLDPALLRPGRFDRRVSVARPDVRGREAILRVHLRKLPAVDVDVEVLARGTPGFTGAGLANLVNEAALLAGRRNKDRVEMADFEEAKDKLLMGADRRSLVMSEDERRNTAYHEAGHAIVAGLTPAADPVHKVTIIPRGRALGLTQQLPTEDRYTMDREYVEGRITVLMGGRAAEEVALSHVTNGAGNDIEQATALARRMVCEWGMSETLGPLAYKRGDNQPFLGRELSGSAEYSEATAHRIDEEVRTIVSSAYDRARDMLRNNRKALDNLANRLLEEEVISGDAVREVLQAAVDGGMVPETA